MTPASTPAPTPDTSVPDTFIIGPPGLIGALRSQARVALPKCTPLARAAEEVDECVVPTSTDVDPLPHPASTANPIRPIPALVRMVIDAPPQPSPVNDAAKASRGSATRGHALVQRLEVAHVDPTELDLPVHVATAGRVDDEAFPLLGPAVRRDLPAVDQDRRVR